MGQCTSHGFAANTHEGRLSWTRSGMVESERKEPGWIGALAQTNNTGELTAMHYALQRALQSPRGREVTVIHSDSLYAIHMTTGKWLPRCVRNRELIAHMRSLYRQVQRQRPNEVTLRHVRSHICIPGNELADRLAELRGDYYGTGVGESVRWLRAYLRAISARCRHDPMGGGRGGEGDAARGGGDLAGGERSNAERGDGGGDGGRRRAGPLGPGTLGDRIGVG